MPITEYSSTAGITAAIFERLKQQGMTSADIARALSVPRQRVWEWQQGTHEPKEATLQTLAAMAGRRITYRLARSTSSRPEV